MKTKRRGPAKTRPRCLQCGRRFTTLKRGGRKTCSDECKLALHRANLDAIRAAGKDRYWRGRKGGPNPRGRFTSEIQPPPDRRVPPPRVVLSPTERKARRLARALKRSSEVSLSPRRIKEIRAEIAECVSEQLGDAHRVVMGTDGKTWSPTQARVFGMLLNKVIPDLHASYVKRETEDEKPLTELSRDELEKIVAGMKTIEASKPPGSHRRDPSEIADAEIIEDDEPEPPAGYYEED